MNAITIFENLVKNKSVEVRDGFNLKCGYEVNLKIYQEGDDVVIHVQSPSVHAEISKMGPLNLVNFLNPSVEKIIITPTSYRVVLNNLPDIEVKRDISNS